MIEQLFGSKTRVKLLQLFYSNPNRPFFVREITRKIDEQINSVRRELANLLNIGIISSDQPGNKLYYEVNTNFEYFHQLTEIFGEKSESPDGAEDSEENEKLPGMKQLGRVDLVVMSGKFTRDERSGADLLLVGDINQSQINKFITDLEKKEGKDISYVVMTNKEFNYRKKIKDRFLSVLLESKKQVLIDKYDLLSNNKNTEHSDKKVTKTKEKESTK